MANVLVLYASQEGQTREIAEFVGETLKDDAHKVAVQSVYAPPPLAAFDAVMLGASIHVGRYPDEVIRYVRAHLAELERVPTAFFSVCMMAAQDDAAHREVAESYLDKMVHATRWQPDLSASFGGALKSSAYGFVKRQRVRALVRRNALDIDPTNDNMYTDWDRVTTFTQLFSKQIETAQHPTLHLREEGVTSRSGD